MVCIAYDINFKQTKARLINQLFTFQGFVTELTMYDAFGWNQIVLIGVVITL